MSVHNLKSYRESLALIPDMEYIIRVLNFTEIALQKHSHYLPAYKVMCSARDQRRMLEIHYKELLAIKNSKGKKV